jgi:nitrite reductase/ring-hydroxylating ferredoxin subunit
MDDASAVAAVGDVPDLGSYLFTVREPNGREEEVILVRTDDGIAAWKNFCMHEPDQRLDRGVGSGAAMRDGEIVCPRHGSTFDAETGYCDNGKAAGQSLVPVDVTVVDDTVYLTADDLAYLHEGGIEDDLPGSTSHISF